MDQQNEDKKEYNYFCGIARTKRGKVNTFATVLKNPDTIQEDIDVFTYRLEQQQNNTIIRSCIHKSKKADFGQFMDQMLEDYKQQRERRRQEKQRIKAGSIVKYVDGNGEHDAIVLRPGRIQSLMVFATTNPNWNYRARKITSEEQILLGYPDRGRETYLAPVIRDNDAMYPTDKSFPLHRVTEMIEEFGFNNE